MNPLPADPRLFAVSIPVRVKVAPAGRQWATNVGPQKAEQRSAAILDQAKVLRLG